MRSDPRCARALAYADHRFAALGEELPPLRMMRSHPRYARALTFTDRCFATQGILAYLTACKFEPKTAKNRQKQPKVHVQALFYHKTPT